MGIVSNAKLEKEEKVVAELASLGILYLSRQSNESVPPRRNVAEILADVVVQPSSRVRTAVIALFLEHPKFAGQLPEAMSKLPPREQMTLKFFYSAAVFLQQIYQDEFQKDDDFSRLPDLFSGELNIPQGLPLEKSLELLGKRHAEDSDMHLNWAGTYKKTALDLINRRRLEVKWNR